MKVSTIYTTNQVLLATVGGVAVGMVVVGGGGGTEAGRASGVYRRNIGGIFTEASGV